MRLGPLKKTSVKARCVSGEDFAQWIQRVSTPQLEAMLYAAIEQAEEYTGIALDLATYSMQYAGFDYSDKHLLQLPPWQGISTPRINGTVVVNLEMIDPILEFPRTAPEDGTLSFLAGYASHEFPDSLKSAVVSMGQMQREQVSEFPQTVKDTLSLYSLNAMQASELPRMISDFDSDTGRVYV